MPTDLLYYSVSNSQVFDHDLKPTLLSINGLPAAKFEVWPVDPLALATDDLTFSVRSSDGIKRAEAHLTVAVPPLQLAPDTLYAIPLQREVEPWERANVLIATGPTAHPFQQLANARLILTAGLPVNWLSAVYVWPGYYAFQSGQDGYPVGGAWAAFGRPDLTSRDFVYPYLATDRPVDLGDGRLQSDISLVPELSLSPIPSASGVLCTVDILYVEPGVKTFGFAETALDQATRYSDGTTDYVWGNIANDGSGGIRNSVEVVP